MALFPFRSSSRRHQARAQRARQSGSRWRRAATRAFQFPVLACGLFIVLASLIAISASEETLRYSIGERITQPIYALVDFRVPDPAQTARDREAASAKVPSYYKLNNPAITFDRIRADLTRLYQTGTESDSYEQYSTTVTSFEWPAEEPAYSYLQTLMTDEGRNRFESWVRDMPLEREYILKDLRAENRIPPSSADHIVLGTTDAQGSPQDVRVRIDDLVVQTSEKALTRSAAVLSLTFPSALRPTVQGIILSTLRQQPTIVFDQERTLAAIKRAEESTPTAYLAFEKGKPFIQPASVTGQEGLTSADYDLLRAHHAAYQEFLKETSPEALGMRQQRMLQRAGIIGITAALSIALFVYTAAHQRRALATPWRTFIYAGLMLGTLLAARLIELRLPQFREAIYGPCLLAACVLAIAFPTRFAMGATSILGLMVGTIIWPQLSFLLGLLTGVAVLVYQLEEIRSRTKIIAAGFVAGLSVAAVTCASALMERQAVPYALQHSAWAGGSTLMAAFVVSGILPFVERAFRIATSLTLLEWRDPTRPLLQLLAQRAPGTYNHSLTVGTLVEAACEAIGANALLAQVGALYHDIGKINKAEYFTENQEGRISRHENLSPTMSLLIILGHVKDGIEMARECGLPRAMHAFIEEHHGTTVVRYFHHIAAEKQEQIASGRHDREVAEAEFRYRGPKPRTRETAVLMLADGVEGAVRALAEPTLGRIEHIVHQLVMDRLNDGQFDDCDITLKEIRKVEESLVKTLARIYHGRISYPKRTEKAPERAMDKSAVRARISV